MNRVHKKSAQVNENSIKNCCETTFRTRFKEKSVLKSIFGVVARARLLVVTVLIVCFCYTTTAVAASLNVINSFGPAPKLKATTDPRKFIPKGYELVSITNGDLNNDKTIDCVLLVQATNPANWVVDYYGKKVNRNRRGLIVLFAKNGTYVLRAKNLTCFSSAEEDGGNYMPPDLGLEIKKSKLYISYGHGRYGYWEYCFRWQASNFVLIGYEGSSNRGPIVEEATSINFLTNKTKIRKNTMLESLDGEGIFEVQYLDRKPRPLLKLTDIKDFDELEIEDK
ncbi:hypothetical protein [Flavobacterium sp.]|uniref:hypothetical protein n=1 Tax=Flavobacterium sp. TaxID=239 RepID=UPI002620B13F|nr:hypothetical protein [Flavobacterium sp.]